VKHHIGAFTQYQIFCFLLLVLFLSGCARSTGECPLQPYADLSEVDTYVGNEQLPFQFPLQDGLSTKSLSHTEFCTNSGGPESKRKYHAAEDYFRPAGTPVFAIADGEISFSGPMGGYGWLIIIDHPQANIYSLYGHISPSRWYMESGTVSKGQLIAYLGDSDENGGSAEQPLEPHLHLGIRSGQRLDYPSNGAWRWQAGWIKPCPVDLGWLQPSEIITNQTIPTDGFPEPSASFFDKWWFEFLFAGVYLVGGVCVLLFGTKRDKPLVIIISGVVLLGAGWIFFQDGWMMSYLLIAMGIILATIGAYRIVQKMTKLKRT